jgi:preprotein translocase subunit SecD
MMRRSMGRALGLVACAALAWPGAVWGGGSLDFVLRAARTPSPLQLSRAVAVVRTRAALLGASSVDVKAQGKDEIAVHLGSVLDPSRAKALLASRGRLSFYDLEAALAKRSLDSHGDPIAARKPLRVTKRTSLLRCGGGATVCPGVSASPVKRWFYYLVRGRPAMDGADVVRSKTRADNDPVTGEPVVLMQLTVAGVRIFQSVTAAEAKRGKARWVAAGRHGGASKYFQHFAISLDGRIISFPSIDFQQFPSGINALNGIQIVGLGGKDDAKDLALLVKSGSLPVRFTVAR